MIFKEWLWILKDEIYSETLVEKLPQLLLVQLPLLRFNLNSLSDDLIVLSNGLNGKLKQMSAEVKEQIQSVHNRLDSTAITMSYQQMQLYFIFQQLVLSFAIDADDSSFNTLKTV